MSSIPGKLASDHSKHGIDFVSAQASWLDPDRLEITARSLDEARTQVIGRIGKHEMKKKSGTSAARARTARSLDAMHDAGVDLSAHLDLGSAKRPGRDVQRVNVDFPVELLQEIDRHARRLGVTRQSFIKIRIADSLQRP